MREFVAEMIGVLIFLIILGLVVGWRRLLEVVGAYGRGPD